MIHLKFGNEQSYYIYYQVLTGLEAVEEQWNRLLYLDQLSNKQGDEQGQHKGNS